MSDCLDAHIVMWLESRQSLIACVKVVVRSQHAVSHHSDLSCPALPISWSHS